MPTSALVLVGGLGTQLRPLTLTQPKALLPLGHTPILTHLVKQLAKAHVRNITLAIAFPTALLDEYVEQCAKDFGVHIALSREPEPLGTAGPIALARRHGLLASNEPFFVLNADVACNFNLLALRDFHLEHGKLGTIAVTAVDEPAKYGKSVVVSRESGLIERFVEHGRKFAGNLINAGVYIFSPTIFEYISERPTSMEREVLPLLATEGQLYSMHLDGYWMNVKVPRNFLEGHALYLGAGGGGGLCTADRFPDSTIDGNVSIDETATVGAGSLIGPDVSIGPGAVLGEGVRLARCIVLAGANVGAHSTVLDSIVGWGVELGKWTRVEGVSVLGERVVVAQEVWLDGAVALPGERIDTCIQSRT